MRRAYLTYQDVLRSPSFQIFSVMVLLFLLSLFLFLVQGDRKVTRTFFYPESAFGRSYESRSAEAAAKFFGETRRLPLRSGREANIRLLVDDLILGPMDPVHVRLLPMETRLISLIWRRSALYLNFSAGILEDSKGSDLPLPRRLQAVANTVLFNFPVIKRVFIFIEGEIPDFAAAEGYGDLDTPDFSAGLEYDPSILY